MKRILAVALLFIALAAPLYPQDAAPIPSITFEGTLTAKSDADVLKTVNAIFNFVSNEDNFCIQNIKQKNCLSKFDGTPAYILLGLGEGEKPVSFKINFDQAGRVFGEVNTDNKFPADHQNIIKILMKIKVYFIPNLKVKADNWPGFKNFEFKMKAIAITPPAPMTVFHGISKLTPNEAAETISAFRASREEAGLKILDGAKKIAEARDLRFEATEVYSPQTRFRGFDVWVTPEKPARFKFDITTLDPPTLSITIDETFTENDLAGARVLRDFVNTMLRANKELQTNQLINLENVTDRDERINTIGSPDPVKTPTAITFTPEQPKGPIAPVDVRTPSGATATPEAAPASNNSNPETTAETKVNAMSSVTIFALAGVVIVVIIIVIVMARKK